MSAHRTERLLNLVICLLATRSWLSKEQIRRAVPQYEECAGDEAFDRMFERDKDDLRDLGVPVETGSPSALFEDEIGYRIDPQAYALPPVQLDGAELAVLGLASRVWQQASLAGPAARAHGKLRAMGVSTDEGSLVGVEPRVRTTEPAFEAVYAATRDRAPISFRYRKPDGSSARRSLQPWAVTNRSGRWYLVGQDTDRGAPRAFRLSRVEGGVRRTGPPGGYQVPADLDVRAMVAEPAHQEDERVAVLAVAPGRGTALRRRALDAPADDAPADDDAAVVVALSEGDQPARDVVRVRVGDLVQLSAEIAGHGPDVVVLEPPDLRREVIGRLRAVRERGPGPRQARAAR